MLRLPFLLALTLAAPAEAAKLELLRPLAPGLAGTNRIAGTDVRIGQAAKLNFYLLDQLAADKRTAAGLPPAEGAGPGPRPPREQYATLPLVQMLALVIEDEAARWGLDGPRAIRLEVEIDVLRTGDAAITPLLGTADELSGPVKVVDAGSGETLGEYYVEVRNVTAGAIGLALRGAGVREKLAVEFAARLARELSGRRSPPKRSPPSSE